MHRLGRHAIFCLLIAMLAIAVAVAACPRPGPGPRCQTRGDAIFHRGALRHNGPGDRACQRPPKSEPYLRRPTVNHPHRWRGRTYHGGKRHVHCPGRDSLSAIALRYGTTVAALKKANGLTGSVNLCRQRLIIPEVGSSTKSGGSSQTSGGTGQASVGDRCTSFAGGTRWHQSPTATALPPRQLPKPMAWQIRITSILARSCASPKGVVLRRRQHLHRVVQRIVIDLSEQRMYVYQGEQLLWNWVVSTGRRGQETSAGHFKVLNKIPNAYAPPGACRCPTGWASIGPAACRMASTLCRSSRMASGCGMATWGSGVSFGCVSSALKTQRPYTTGLPSVRRWTLFGKACRLLRIACRVTNHASLVMEPSCPPMSR